MSAMDGRTGGFGVMRWVGWIDVKDSTVESLCEDEPVMVNVLPN